MVVFILLSRLVSSIGNYQTIYFGMKIPMISLELQGKWEFNGTYGLWKTNVVMFKSHILLNFQREGSNGNGVLVNHCVVELQMSHHIHA